VKKDPQQVHHLWECLLPSTKQQTFDGTIIMMTNKTALVLTACLPRCNGAHHCCTCQCSCLPCKYGSFMVLPFQMHVPSRNGITPVASSISHFTSCMLGYFDRHCWIHTDSRSTERKSISCATATKRLLCRKKAMHLNTSEMLCRNLNYYKCCTFESEMTVSDCRATCLSAQGVQHVPDNRGIRE
jgi:hypothetical protein